MSAVERRYELGDGWTLHATGDVLEHDRFSGGHTSSSVGFLPDPGMSHDEFRAASEEARAELAEAAAAPMRNRVELRRGPTSVVLHDAIETPTGGVLCVHLPAVAGPAGVLIRRSITQDRVGPMGGYAGADTTMLGPWLVAPDGEVKELPFEMAVAALCELPDGRWLLPGRDPLWWDSYEEPLSALSPDGTTEELLVGGVPLTTRRLVEALAPDWLTAGNPREPAPDPLDSDFPFSAARARVDGNGVLRIQAWDDDPDETTEAVRWLTVVVDLAGAETIALIDRGVSAAKRPAAIPF